MEKLLARHMQKLRLEATNVLIELAAKLTQKMQNGWSKAKGLNHWRHIQVVKKSGFAFVQIVRDKLKFLIQVSNLALVVNTALVLQFTLMTQRHQL